MKGSTKARVVFWATVVGGGYLLTRRAALAASRPALSETFKAAVVQLVGALKAAGIPVKVGQVGRTGEEQAAALAAGRSAASLSQHERGLAVDLYPLDPATGRPDLAGKNTALYRRMHAVAAGLGWRGLAFNPDGSVRYLTARDGRRFWDGAHLQWTG